MKEYRISINMGANIEYHNIEAKNDKEAKEKFTTFVDQKTGGQRHYSELCRFNEHHSDCEKVYFIHRIY